MQEEIKDINTFLPNEVCAKNKTIINKDINEDYEYECDCEYEYNKKLYSNVQKYLVIGELHTYKSLCEILKENKYSGNSKIKHLKELSRYFDFYYITHVLYLKH